MTANYEPVPRAPARDVQSAADRPHLHPATPHAESDPHGIDPKTGGAKMDAGKIDIYAMFMDYFPRAVITVAYVSEYGARKYHAKGWEKVPDGYARYSAADIRHIMYELMGTTYDIHDSGLAHAAQHAWNAMARLELALQKGTLNCVVGNVIKDGKPVLGTTKVVPLPQK